MQVRFLFMFPSLILFFMMVCCRYLGFSTIVDRGFLLPRPKKQNKVKENRTWGPKKEPAKWQTCPIEGTHPQAGLLRSWARPDLVLDAD
jgi:hypothetical protein